MRHRPIVLLITLGLLACAQGTVGCGEEAESGEVTTVRRLASEEFNCPSEFVGVDYHSTSLDEEREYYLAYGCGYQAMYECRGISSCSKVEHAYP